MHAQCFQALLASQLASAIDVYLSRRLRNYVHELLQNRDANVDGEQMDDLLLRIRQASTNLGQTNTARIMSEISEYEIMMKEFIEDHLAAELSSAAEYEELDCDDAIDELESMRVPNGDETEEKTGDNFDFFQNEWVGQTDIETKQNFPLLSHSSGNSKDSTSSISSHRRRRSRKCGGATESQTLCGIQQAVPQPRYQLECGHAQHVECLFKIICNKRCQTSCGACFTPLSEFDQLSVAKTYKAMNEARKNHERELAQQIREFDGA